MAGSMRTEAMLAEELGELRPNVKYFKPDQILTHKDIVAALGNANLNALCLSGGGIRSAAFSLGAVQALATLAEKGDKATKSEESLLKRFDYLSTVSGGGYTGSFLSTWLTRTTFDNVWKNLTGRPDGPENEAKPLQWLRDYSSYLTPRSGAASPDWWADIVLVVRNMVLNWFVLLPMLSCAILLVDALSFFTGWLSKGPPVPIANPWLCGFSAALVVCLLLSLRFTTRNRPTRRGERAMAGKRAFLFGDALWLCLGGIVLTFLLVLPSTYAFLREVHPGPLQNSNSAVFYLAVGAVGGAVLYALSWVAAARHSVGRGDKFWDWLAWTIAGAFFGTLIMLGVYMYTVISNGSVTWLPVPQFVALIGGLPWVLFAYGAAEVIFVGLSSYEEDGDNDREWLARAAGFYAVFGAIWLVGLGAVILGYTAAEWVLSEARTLFASTTIMSAIGTAFLSWTARTPAQGPAKTKTAWTMNAALTILAPICAIGIVLWTSIFLDWALFGHSLTSVELFHSKIEQDLSYPPWLDEYSHLVVALLIIGVVGIAAGYFININRFSMHALYRNRIVRAFLGASHIAKKPTRDPFSGFDDNDNLNMHMLWASSEEEEASAPEQAASDVPQPPNSATTVLPPDWSPFHVINIALNLVSPQRISWQERKAESFTVTPLRSGCSRLGYQPSDSYGDQDGITVGTAVAISGAAASPNMGYHSSPPLAFLMTWFNVRLGWWLGNPRFDDVCSRPGPRFAQIPLVQELIGYTTDERKFVYLSDGGHFENLGLYEMVRRRCHRIIVVDAGCDPDFSFEDLGNAVRKVWIDLGVRVSIDDLQDLQSRTKTQPEGKDRRSFASGTLHYKDADGDGADGRILYIKPTFYEDLINNVGVRNYGAAHVDFPHQSTADQWFDESQFESYRALGFQLALEAVEASGFKDW